MVADMKVYSGLRKTFLTEHPICEICGTNKSRDVHHKFLRGKHYLNVKTFAAVCRPCHSERIHGDPNNARKMGWLIE